MTWQWAMPIAVAIALGLATPRLLRALPPPFDEPEARPDALATRGFAAVALVLTTLAWTLVLSWRRCRSPGQGLARSGYWPP